jgi:hypothetical protein
VKKNAIFNRQLTNALKLLTCCEGTVVGLKLSEDGANIHRKALMRELIRSDGTHRSSRHLVNKRVVEEAQLISSNLPLNVTKL